MKHGVNPVEASTWSSFRRLLQYVRPYSGRLFLGFGLGLLFGAANASLVWVIRGGIREVFDPERVSLSAVIIAALFFPVVGFVRGLANYLARYYIRWVGNRVVMDMRNQMFSHIHQLSVSYFSRSRTGELISRISNDTMQIERAVSTGIGDIVTQPPTLIAMVVWIFMVDARLALVSLIVFPVCLVPIAVFGRKVRRYQRQSQERIADVISIVQESVSGVRIVKAFGMEEHETARFIAQTKAFFSRIMRVARATLIVEPIIVVIAATGVALVLVYVKTADMKVDEFFAFSVALFMMYEPIKRLGKVHIQIQQSSAAADRLFEVLDTESAVKEKADATALSGGIKEISFEGVSFGYTEQHVLRDITFCVRAGERVALVGGSGVGKTTLVSLIPRFFDVTGGRIAINGHDIRDLTFDSLRSRIGLVTQETFLFNDTVTANIGYGTENASQADIEQAAHRAHAHDFITTMAQGYDTVVGERGVRLSGGQCQRLAIARAILRNPPILVLDEATSALDTESERMVQQALDELMKGRTVFAIAHRLSTIMNCDRIIVLDDGRIIEQGTHQELVARNGIYRRLHDMQSEQGHGT
jgi:subfamily B ATP-binding cassette protein MsbA